jgi:hypothetical protein
MERGEEKKSMKNNSSQTFNGPFLNIKSLSG